MEYSDVNDQVEPGEELVADHESLGHAAVDSDHDGVADSVIIGVDDKTVMFTDTDGDGEADQRTVYDSDGNVVDQKDLDSTGPDDSDSDSTTPDSSDGGGSGSDTTSPDEPDDTQNSQDGVITMVDDEGRSVDVGPPTVDMDGDGTPDTAVVQGDDGSTIGYTDRNGDGEADQITRITADRHVSILVVDSSGEWVVAQTGTLDENGHFVPDEGSDGPDSRGSDAEGLAWTLPQVDTPTEVPVATAEGEADQAVADTTAATQPIVYTDPDGNTYELGLPTEDFNGDGQVDTVITTLDDGTIVVYSDVDGDGLTDQVTQINTDGSVTIGVPDGVGGWEEAATGSLGENGEFVPARANWS
ncbi:MAG: hypothetical protein INR72_10835 [Williamsia herbipolensis]|nr:hypothetical protein [Williamsia herbipolensis]